MQLDKKYDMDVYSQKGVLSIMNSDALHTVQLSSHTKTLFSLSFKFLQQNQNGYWNKNDVSKIDLTTQVLGFKISMPIMVAPTAMQKMAHPEGKDSFFEGYLSKDQQLLHMLHNKTRQRDSLYSKKEI